jgi:hypothetical protein
MRTGTSKGARSPCIALLQAHNPVNSSTTSMATRCTTRAPTCGSVRPPRIDRTAESTEWRRHASAEAPHLTRRRAVARLTLVAQLHAQARVLRQLDSTTFKSWCALTATTKTRRTALCTTAAQTHQRIDSLATAFWPRVAAPVTPPVVPTTPPVVPPTPPVVPSTPPTTPPPTSGAAIGVPAGSVLAELPRAVPDCHVSERRLARSRIAAGADLQAALNAATCGDELLLPAGSTWIGNFALSVKSCTGWIVLRTDATIPPPGVRVGPTLSAALSLAKIVTPTNQPAIATALSAHHWRLSGLEVTSDGRYPVYSLIGFGDGSTAQNSVALEAHDLILDHSYVHGGSAIDLRRCVALNSASTAIVDSWLGECHSNNGDSQSINGTNGDGPYLIQNNTLESGHQAFMFGGGDPHIPNLVPSDITIRGNHMTRPVAWRTPTPGHTPIPVGYWQTKTIAETKNARRMLIEGNVIENVWADAQVGFAILLKSSNQDGSAPWSTTQDVTVRYNRVRNVGAVFNIAAHPEQYPVVPAARFAIYDNDIDAVNVGSFTGAGIGLQVLGDVSDVIFAHNSILAPTGNSITMFDGNPNTRFVMHSNVTSAGQYGIIGSATGVGNSSLARWTPGALVANNAIVGTGLNCGVYPATTSCLAAWPTTAIAGYDGRPAGPDLVKVTDATMGAVVAP